MTADKLPRLILTPGEPAGIGPELAVRLAQQELRCALVAAADAGLLRDAAKAIGLALSIEDFDPERPPAQHRAGSLVCWNVPLETAVVPGTLDPRNAGYVVRTLDRASAACLSGRFDALVTGPVHKGVINQGGHPFIGHTEFFADRAGCPVVMMLAAPRVRVALATTHLSLRRVPDAITQGGLESTLRILHADLRRRFGIAKPRIAVLGLNPHAGEGGHLGREEIEVIAPALQRLRGEGFQLEGPLAADTAFVPERIDRADAFLAMYHDQGLPVLKALGFGEAVNITLGLPYVRTSVDHGVALDLAGSGRADPASLIEAVRMAIELA